MKSWLYDASLWGYWQGIKLAAPFNEKANLFREGRRNWKTELQKKFEKIKQPVAWFHCASLGEFEQGRPLIEAFKENYPNYKILLTFFSPSGYEIRKNYEKADIITYLPLDTPRNAESFLKIAKPKIAFFVKYEFWYHFIREVHKQNIPLLSVSTIFREEQHFFKQENRFSSEMLEGFTHFFVQNESSKQLLESINIKNVEVSGDTRFDRVAHVVSMGKELPIIEKFVGNHQLLVVGSSWKEDIEYIAAACKNIKKMKAQDESNFKYKIREEIANFKLVVAPHTISPSDIQNVEKEFDFLPTERYSKVNLQDKASLQRLKQADVLIIDNIGLLSSIYSYGDVGYIGGAFGKGLHNILEAATFGMPIIFGDKNYKKFKEATDLLEKKGAFAVSNAKEIEELLKKLFTDEYFREQINEITREYVIQNTGATQKIMNYVAQIID